MKSYFRQNKSGDTSGLNAPISIEIKNLNILLLKWANRKKKHFFPFMFLILICWIFILFLNSLLMLSFVLLTFLLLFCILFILFREKKIIACLLKGNKIKKKFMKIKRWKKKCWGYPKHLFELLVIAIACVQRYIFYEKESKN